MTAGAAVALLLLAPAVATADDDLQQHNVTYRARVDGIARGALITYRINDAQVNSADPTMLPGRTFETTAVLTDENEAGMRISIQWPYSANLHCEILVDDRLVVQASQFISPRLTPAKDDPDFGALNCGAPLSNAFGAPTPPAVPADPLEPGGTLDPGATTAAVPPADVAPAVPPADLPAAPMLPGEEPPLDSLPVDVPPAGLPTAVAPVDPNTPIA